MDLTLTPLAIADPPAPPPTPTVHPRPFILGTIFAALAFLLLVAHLSLPHMMKLEPWQDSFAADVALPMAYVAALFAAAQLLAAAMPPATTTGRVGSVILRIAAWLFLANGIVLTVINFGGTLRFHSERYLEFTMTSHGLLLVLVAGGMIALARVGKSLNFRGLSSSAKAICCVVLVGELLINFFVDNSRVFSAVPLFLPLDRLGRSQESTLYHLIFISPALIMFLLMARRVLKLPRATALPVIDHLEIAGDFPCGQCHYNLRTKRSGERCPECGTPVDTSLKFPPGWDGFRHRRFAVGALIVLISYLLTLSVYAMMIMFQRSEEFPQKLVAELLFLASAFFLTGLLLMTTTLPTASRRWKVQTLRLLAIIQTMLQWVPCVTIWKFADSPGMRWPGVIYVITAIAAAVLIVLAVVSWAFVQPRVRAMRMRWFRMFANMYVCCVVMQSASFCVLIFPEALHSGRSPIPEWIMILCFSIYMIFMPLLHIAFWTTCTLLFWKLRPPVVKLVPVAAAPQPTAAAGM